MSVRMMTMAAAGLALFGGTGLATGVFAPAQAQTAPATDPNRLFADSKLVVGERISVEVVGKGPDLILVPGLSSSRETWRRTAERLRGRYRLHLVQVAGFAGEPSRSNASGPVLEPTAEAIDAYIVAAHLSPAVYIGHSLGGTMGLYIAQHHPEHLDKLLLVDSLPFFGVLMGGPAATSASVKPIAEQMERATSGGGTGYDPTPMLAAMVKDPQGLKIVLASSKASDGKTVGRAMAEDMMLDLRPGLAAMKTPVTLIYPYEAGRVPLAQWDGLYNSQFAPLPTKTLVRVDDSRHFVMYDQPAKFDAALDAFLAK